MKDNSMPKSGFVGAIAGIVLTAVLSACVGFEHNSTVVSPSDPVLRSCLGDWASAAATVFPTPRSCAAEPYASASAELAP
jgi:hypothetical protein